MYNFGPDGDGEVMKAVSSERDLGVTLGSDCRFTDHMNAVISKANQLLGLVKRAFEYKESDLIKNLYTCIVRPHLEYANVVWSPYYKKEKEALERVQHRATRLVPGFSHLTYEERLRRMDLPTLTYRRHRGDMIEVFKYLNGVYSVDGSAILPRDIRDGPVTRGHFF